MTSFDAFGMFRPYPKLLKLAIIDHREAGILERATFERSEYFITPKFLVAGTLVVAISKRCSTYTFRTSLGNTEDELQD